MQKLSWPLFNTTAYILVGVGEWGHKLPTLGKVRYALIIPSSLAELQPLFWGQSSSRENGTCLVSSRAHDLLSLSFLCRTVVQLSRYEYVQVGLEGLINRPT